MAPGQDERYLVIDGRRWRRTDPAIPDGLRKELVAELMDARRAVKAAAGAQEATAVARARVDAAKRALGERGHPWWEDAGPEERHDRLVAAVTALARHRAPSTICPSDAARVVGGAGWRGLMDEARAVARELAVDGSVEVLQKGTAVDPAGEWRGPVRIRSVDSGGPSS